MFQLSFHSLQDGLVLLPVLPLWSSQMAWDGEAGDEAKEHPQAVTEQEGEVCSGHM